MQIKPFLAKTTAGVAAILTLGGAGNFKRACAEEASFLVKEGATIAEKYTPKSDSFKTVQSGITDMQSLASSQPNSMTKLRSGQNSGGAVFKNPDATMGGYVAATDEGKIYLIDTQGDPISATRKISNYLPGVFNDGKDEVINGKNVVYSGLNLDTMLPVKLDKNAPERLAEPFNAIKDAKQRLEMKVGQKFGADPSGVDFSTTGVNAVYNSKSHNLGKGFTGSWNTELNYANVNTKTNGNGPKITEVSFDQGRTEKIAKSETPSASTIQQCMSIPQGVPVPSECTALAESFNSGNFTIPENFTVPENLNIPTLKSIAADAKEMTYNVFGLNANGVIKTPNLLKSDSAQVKGFANLNLQGNYVTAKGKSLVSGETYSSNNGDFAGGLYSGLTGKIGDANKEAHATGFGGVRIEKMTDLEGKVGTQNTVVYGGELGGSYSKDISGHKLTLSGKASDVQVNAHKYTVNSLLTRGDASVQKGAHTISGHTQFDKTTTTFPELGKHEENNLTYGGGYKYNFNKNTDMGVDCSTTGKDINCISGLNWKF